MSECPHDLQGAGQRQYGCRQAIPEPERERAPAHPWDRRARRDEPIYTDRMRRLLIVLGVTFVVAGLLWPWVRRLPLFHLPGDIVIDRPTFKFFFPITTMLLLSAVLSLLAWIFRK
jgi:hypothetical protein